MENLARAYKENLADSAATSNIEDAIAIVTRQLGIIAEMSTRVVPKNSALSYLQTVKMDTYTALLALLPKERSPLPYVPERVIHTGYNYLINTQIELFYTLAKIKANGNDIGNIDLNESRAFTAIVAMRG